MAVSKFLRSKNMCSLSRFSSDSFARTSSFVALATNPWMREISASLALTRLVISSSYSRTMACDALTSGCVRSATAPRDEGTTERAGDAVTSTGRGAAFGGMLPKENRPRRMDGWG